MSALHADGSEAIADVIVSSLTPSSVLDAGGGDGRLVAALRARGVEAACSADDTAEAAARTSYDLIVCLPPSEPGLSHCIQDDAAALCGRAAQVLFRPRSGEAAADYLERFAAYGFAPVLSFDADSLGPRTVLFERRTTTPGERAAYAETLELRAALANARRQQAATRVQAETLTRNLRQLPMPMPRLEQPSDLSAIEAARAFARAVLPLRVRQILFVLRSPKRLRSAIVRRLRGRAPRAASLPLRPVATQPTPRIAPVDIVVCVHNAPDDVRRCLSSVLERTLPPYRLILVDDGSAEPTRDYLRHFATAHHADLIRNDTATGYTRAANAGLRASTSPWVVLLNSDTIVTDGWLDRMVELAERDERIGLVGPVSNTASWQSVPEIFRADGDWAENVPPPGVTPDDLGRLAAAASSREGVPLPFLNGFCLLIRRTMLDDIGIFDEETFGAGFGEENDYCIRARQGGWRLMVAEDAYVFHAQSRSYTSERRLKLARNADAALRRKHPARDIDDPLQLCKDSLGLASTRARVASALRRETLVAAGQSRWEGRRLGIILPVAEAGGGANVLIQEARALRRMGVDVWFANLIGNRESFERAYPGLDFPVLFEQDGEALGRRLADPALRLDALIASLYSSVNWTPPAEPGRPIGYYAQDFEPRFFAAGSREYDEAMGSYLVRRDLITLTKSTWNAEQIAATGAPWPHVIGPSVDIDLYAPAGDANAGVQAPVHVCAMVRPETPRRAPELTLSVLRQLAARYGQDVEITVFGTAALPTADRSIRNAGQLTPPQVADLLGSQDVFLDFSEWQAMGLTALEAMACGCAVVVPQDGGAGEFVRDGETGLLVDTRHEAACLMAARLLIEDHALRRRLRLAAVAEAARHPPEVPAYELMSALFPDDSSKDEHGAAASAA